MGGSNCFIGVERGAPRNNPGYSGECLGCIGPAPPPPPPPPPPSPLPQLYHNLSMGTAPLTSQDLASGTAWTLSVCGGPARPIIVPGGGYNSDLQPKPWIDGYSLQTASDCLSNFERLNVTYERLVQVPAATLSSRAIPPALPA